MSVLVGPRAEDGEFKSAKNGHEGPLTESDTAFNNLKHFPTFTEDLRKAVAQKALEIQLQEIFDKEGCSKRMQRECSHPSAAVLCKTLHIPQTCQRRFLTEHLPKLFEQTAQASPTKECAFMLAKSNPANDTYLLANFSLNSGKAFIRDSVNNQVQFDVVDKDFHKVTAIFVDKLTDMIKLHTGRLFLSVYGGLNVLGLIKKLH